MSDRRVQTACLLIMALISIGVALWLLQPVLVPFVLALFFSQCLAPVIKLLMRKFRLPQMVAVGVTVVLAAGVLTGVGFILAGSASGVTDQNLESFKQSLTSMLHRVESSRPAQIMGIPANGDTESYINFAKGYGGSIFQQYGGSISKFLLTQIANAGSILLLMAFLLLGRRSPHHQRSGIIHEIEARVQRYISLTVFISALTGVLVGAPLAILGVKFAAGFGFLAFLLNFIPNVGAVIATVLPVPIILLDPQMHGHFVVQILAIAIPAGMQVLVGSLQPRLMGNSLDLHPVVVLLSLLFFTMIWGVGGAFLATPLTAVIKIVFEKIPATRPLAAALAGNLEPLTETIDPPTKEVMVVVGQQV